MKEDQMKESGVLILFENKCHKIMEQKYSKKGIDITRFLSNTEV